MQSLWGPGLMSRSMWYTGQLLTFFSNSTFFSMKNSISLALIAVSAKWYFSRKYLSKHWLYGRYNSCLPGDKWTVSYTPGSYLWPGSYYDQGGAASMASISIFIQEKTGATLVRLLLMRWKQNEILELAFHFGLCQFILLLVFWVC